MGLPGPTGRKGGEMARLVVIGGDAAGMSAASQAKRLKPSLEVVVLEKGEFISYAACGIPYFLGGVVSGHQALLHYPPSFFEEKRGIHILLSHEAKAIDLERREVEVASPGGTLHLAFDYLMIATGAKPVVPPLPGVESPGVFALRGLDSAIALKEFLEAERPARAVVVGGSYIGLEMAEALRGLGLDVALVEMLPHVMPSLDQDMAVLVEEELLHHGVELHLEERLEGIEADGRLRAVVTSAGKIPADLVVLGVGVRPESTLAREAGIELGAAGAVAVDARSRTSAEGVFAGGDCAHAHHLLLGEPAWVPLGTTANKQGRVAGSNIAGRGEVFPGILGTAVVKVFNLDVARTGLSEREARERGIEAVSLVDEGRSRARYYPGGGRLVTKVVAEKGTGKLLGAQLVGAEAAKRIDIFATALHAGMDLDQFAWLDLAYAPPYSPVWDPVLVAAGKLREAMAREAGKG